MGDNNDEQALPLRAPGGISLAGASVDGDVLLRMALIGEVVGQAVVADKIHCKGNFELTGAELGGDVDLTDSRIDGSLIFRDAKVPLRSSRPSAGPDAGTDSNEFEPAVVCLARAVVKFDLDIRFRPHAFEAPDKAGDAPSAPEGGSGRNESERPSRILDLSFAHVGRLLDDKETIDLSCGRFNRIGGFRYDSLHEDAPIDARMRIAWIQAEALHIESRFKSALFLRNANGEPVLAAPPNFNPQPYEQLYKVLRAAGNGTEARRIAVAKNRDHRRWGR